MKTMRAIFLLAIAATLAQFPATPSHAAATFYIYVMDGATEGFNDPAPFTPVGGNTATTLGAARLQAFQRAVDIWASCLVSPVPIEVTVQMDPMSCTPTAGVLGAAGAVTVHKNFTGAPIWDTYYPQALANSLAGYDLSILDADIDATFNSDVGTSGCLATSDWYYGLDGNPPIGDIDFVTVVLHELGHGLGVQTFVNLSTGVKFLLTDDGYERNLEGHFAVPSFYSGMSDAQRVVANTSDPDLHWINPAVNAAGAGLSAGVSNGHVRMHGPSTLVPGSSVNHFSNALSPNELMEPNYTGANHDPGMAANLLNDIGWKIENKTLDVCDGAVVDMAVSPARIPATVGYAGASNKQHGAYVTALKDFDVCAVGLEADYFVGQNVTVAIYDAAGTSRGTLLAWGSEDIDFSGNHVHYVPIQYVQVTSSLEACHDYDIAVAVFEVFSMPVWLTPDPMYPLPAVPFDADGVIRVRSGEQAGVPNPETPHLSLIGSVPTPTNTSDITEPAIVWSTVTDASTARGVFVHAIANTRVCGVSFEADFPTYNFLDDIRANVYDANSGVRGNLIATGVSKITNVGGGVPVPHTIPLNVRLETGLDYDIEVVYPPATYSFYFQGPTPAPFDVDGRFRVIGGEMGGVWPDPFLAHFTLSYEDGTGGDVLDLAGPFHGPPSTGLGPVDGGMYVLANATGDINSIGWKGDVPAGQFLVARVYESSLFTRTTLVAEGTIRAAEAGLRWHDIPIAADLQAGGEYDLVVIAGNANQWPWWDDTKTPTRPYNAYGYFTIEEGEVAGNPTDPTLLQMRVEMCRQVPVGVSDGPVQAPRFTMATPFPNPVSTSATIRFSLDEEAPVSITVYDVLGRRVADVVDNTRYPAGPAEVRFERGNLASGVYFVKMQTPAKSLSRRMVLLR